MISLVNYKEFGLMDAPSIKDCFKRGYPEYPCMLCGICLETLEELLESYNDKKPDSYRQELLEKLRLTETMEE